VAAATASGPSTRAVTTGENPGACPASLMAPGAASITWDYAGPSSWRPRFSSCRELLFDSTQAGGRTGIGMGDARRSQSALSTAPGTKAVTFGRIGEAAGLQLLAVHLLLHERGRVQVPAACRCGKVCGWPSGALYGAKCSDMRGRLVQRYMRRDCTIRHMCSSGLRLFVWPCTAREACFWAHRLGLGSRGGPANFVKSLCVNSP
jgi:hypothetical protein